MQKLTLLLAMGLLYCNCLTAQTTMDTLKRYSDSVLEKYKKELKMKIDSSALPVNGEGLFDVSEKARKNPSELYNASCDTCKTGCKTCPATKPAKAIRPFAWLLLIFIVVLGFWAFKKTALCRDESYIRCADNQLMPRNELERPYSFARVQLFWWAMIISCCYLIFYALYGNLLPLNATCVILLGGVIATQLLGKVIDDSQIAPSTNGQPTEANANRHQDVNPSKNFLMDILSDDHGVSIHRLQGVIFNLIYGLGFVGYFILQINCCKYPLIDFEGWQFTLLGISTTGYLGLKTTENNPATRAARNRTPVAPAGDGQ